MANVALGITISGALVSLLVCVISMFQMVANRKEGTPLFSQLFANPFNIIFRPNDLTNRGLSARRRTIYGFVGFLAFVSLIFLAAMIWPW